MATNLSSTDSFPALTSITVGTSWETITLPIGCRQVDVYAAVELKFDYASTPSIEAPIAATTWFTVYHSNRNIQNDDKTFSLKAASSTTVYLRML